MIIFSTFKDSLNETLKNGSFYIALAIAVIIAITIAVILIRGRKKK